ncbi:hypothetical protein BX616_004781, partial [Lobosporangium transversale]
MSAQYPVSEPTPQTSDVIPLPENEGVILLPLEFILKTWLATGDSVIGTALEGRFWKAISAFVVHNLNYQHMEGKCSSLARICTNIILLDRNSDYLLNLCSDLFAEAYDNVRYRAELITSEALQLSIITWLDDPMMNIRNPSKMQRRPYRARIETMWTQCILGILLKCSPSSTGIGGPNSAFGLVFPAPLTTIRSIYQQTQKWQKPSSASNPANPFLDTKHAAKDVDSTSGPLAQLSPLLFTALNSHHKSIQLKLLATISVPGWKFEDNSQTEVPQFASLSQEMLSLPQELHVRSESGLSRLSKEKAAAAQQLSSKKNKRTQA